MFSDEVKILQITYVSLAIIVSLGTLYISLDQFSIWGHLFPYVTLFVILLQIPNQLKIWFKPGCKQNTIMFTQPALLLTAGTTITAIYYSLTITGAIWIGFPASFLFGILLVLIVVETIKWWQK